MKTAASCLLSTQLYFGIMSVSPIVVEDRPSRAERCVVRQDNSRRSSVLYAVVVLP